MDDFVPIFIPTDNETSGKYVNFGQKNTDEVAKKDTFHNNMLNIFRCPFTKSIHTKGHILTDDGYIYSQGGLSDYFRGYDYQISPITKQRIYDKTSQVPLFAQLVEEYSNIVPITQYMFIESNNYIDNKNIIYRHITNKDFTKLLQYKEFILFDSNINGENLIWILSTMCDDLKIFKYILENSIDLYDVSQPSRFTVLHYVCMYSNLDIIKYVLTLEFDIQQKTVDGRNILLLAVAKNKNRDIIPYLINDKKMNPDEKTNYSQSNIQNMTSFEIMCRYNFSIDMFKYFQSINKALEILSNGDYTLLTILEFCNDLDNDLDFITYLKNLGWRFNITNNNGCLPIHFAARCSPNTKIIELILQITNNIGLDVEDKTGWKPIHYAFRYNNSEIILYFACLGKNLKDRIKNYNGTPANYTPIELLQKNNNKNIKNDDYDMINDIVTSLSL